MHAPRPRMTIRSLMGLVLSCAFCMGVLAALRTQVVAWEARRVEMYRQRDAVEIACDQVREVVAASGRTIAGVGVRTGGARGRTADWTVWAEADEDRDGRRTPLVRIAVSGRNGRLSSELDPIRIETYGGALDGPCLEVFRRVCHEHGWRYQVVRADPSAVFPPRP